MSQRQRGRGEDRDRRAGITLTGEYVEDDVGGMNAVGDRLGACDFDRRQCLPSMLSWVAFGYYAVTAVYGLNRYLGPDADPHETTGSARAPHPFN